MEKLNNNKIQIVTWTTVLIMTLIRLLCIPNYLAKVAARYSSDAHTCP